MTFAVNFLFVLTENSSPLILFSNILPGFIYAILLCNFKQNKLNIKNFLFIVFSSGLFIFVAKIATGYSFLTINSKFCFPVASIIGSSFLLILYYILIDRNIKIKKGILLAIGIGLLSSISPFIGDSLEKGVHSYAIKDDINLLFTLLIFPIWQTLFGWTLSRI